MEMAGRSLVDPKACFCLFLLRGQGLLILEKEEWRDEKNIDVREKHWLGVSHNCCNQECNPPSIRNGMMLQPSEPLGSQIASFQVQYFKW